MVISIRKNGSTHNQRVWPALTVVLFAVVLLTTSVRIGAQGVPFKSDSTGHDGALNITDPGITNLDPKTMKIDPEGDNIFNFTTIHIAAGSILKISERFVHGPVYFRAQGDVVINGVIDIRGADSVGSTATADEQVPAIAGSGGYSGGLGGIHGDPNHKAFAGNGPAGGAAGDVNGPYATGGGFSTNRFLVPLIGGSGGGGTNDNDRYGAQGGAGGGGILIASSTTIRLDGNYGGVNGLCNGCVFADGGSGSTGGCGGAGGAVRLVANTITGSNYYAIYARGGTGNPCLTNASSGVVRLEANSLSFDLGHIAGTSIASLPFDLKLPSSPPPVIKVASINGAAVNANPFSFPDSTINSNSPVPVVVEATNLPVTADVKIYLLSAQGPNQTVPVTLQGTTAASSGTVSVTFPPGGTRGFVKAVTQ